jgi:hypothetical protein
MCGLFRLSSTWDVVNITNMTYEFCTCDKLSNFTKLIPSIASDMLDPIESLCVREGILPTLQWVPWSNSASRCHFQRINLCLYI